SSDVCSSDLGPDKMQQQVPRLQQCAQRQRHARQRRFWRLDGGTMLGGVTRKRCGQTTSPRKEGGNVPVLTHTQECHIKHPLLFHHCLAHQRTVQHRFAQSPIHGRGS